MLPVGHVKYTSEIPIARAPMQKETVSNARVDMSYLQLGNASLSTLSAKNMIRIMGIVLIVSQGIG